MGTRRGRSCRGRNRLWLLPLRLLLQRVLLMWLWGLVVVVVVVVPLLQLLIQ